MANTWDHQLSGNNYVNNAYSYQGPAQHMMQGQVQYQQAGTRQNGPQMALTNGPQ